MSLNHPWLRTTLNKHIYCASKAPMKCFYIWKSKQAKNKSNCTRSKFYFPKPRIKSNVYTINTNMVLKTRKHSCLREPVWSYWHATTKDTKWSIYSLQKPFQKSLKYTREGIWQIKREATHAPKVIKFFYHLFEKLKVYWKHSDCQIGQCTTRNTLSTCWRKPRQAVWFILLN